MKRKDLVALVLGTTLMSAPMAMAGETNAKCGAGKCGASKKPQSQMQEAKQPNAKCGTGKCGTTKEAPKDAKQANAKCGTGKCGSNKQVVEMQNIHGCGLGLRSEFLDSFSQSQHPVDWIEITPENWFQTPQRLRENFEKAIQLYPVVAHGVSLSIGSFEPLDREFLKKMKTFLDRYNIKHYSEHLSFSASSATQTYELLPLPMSHAMIEHLSQRINQVQDILERPLILENASYYIAPYSEMREVDFLCEVLERSNIQLLLDVNNVYVNSINHAFDAQNYIAQIPANRVAYMHVAGHLHYEQEHLLLDTHGEDICEEVWTLLQKTLKTHNAPVMIERDNNIPAFKSLMQEFSRLKNIIGER